LFLLLLGCGGGGGGGGGGSSSGGSAVAPSITAQPTDQRVVIGQTATFTVTASGTAPLSYQWQKGGTSISGATAGSYTTPATTLTDDAATFQVVVTNSAGSATSNSAKLTVAAGTTQARGIDVTTYKNDLNRSGQNLSEMALTLTNVASATFGLLRLLPVDGKVDAQPLYLSKLASPVAFSIRYSSPRSTARSMPSIRTRVRPMACIPARRGRNSGDNAAAVRSVPKSALQPRR